MYKMVFLDVLVAHKQGRQIGTHRVYRKPTHTDRYSLNNSNDLPSQKQGIIETLAKRICGPENMTSKLNHMYFLQRNGYTRRCYIGNYL